MRYILPLIVIIVCGIATFGQVPTDRDLAGLRGKVKSVETSSQSTDEKGKPAYPVEKQSTDEYDRSGNLLKTTHHVSGGRSIYFTLDGKRVSRYEQIPGAKQLMVHVPVGTAADAQPAAARPKGDPRYEHRYEYRLDSNGRVTSVEDHRSDGSLYQVRRFTYDNAGRIAGVTVFEGTRPSHGDIFTYDTNGTVVRRDSVFYLASGEKEVTPFLYSKIKLDSHGNWVERTMSQGEGKDAEVVSIERRKIVYH